MKPPGPIGHAMYAYSTACMHHADSHVTKIMIFLLLPFALQNSAEFHADLKQKKYMGLKFFGLGILCSLAWLLSNFHRKITAWHLLAFPLASVNGPNDM